MVKSVVDELIAEAAAEEHAHKDAAEAFALGLLVEAVASSQSDQWGATSHGAGRAAAGRQQQEEEGWEEEPGARKAGGSTGEARDEHSMYLQGLFWGLNPRMLHDARS